MASNVAVVARVWPATPRQGCNQDSQGPGHHLGRAHGSHTPFFVVRGCRDTVMRLLAVPLNAATTPWRRRRRHAGKVGQRPPLEHSGRKVHAKDQQQWALKGHKDGQESPVTPSQDLKLNERLNSVSAQKLLAVKLPPTSPLPQKEGGHFSLSSHLSITTRYWMIRTVEVIGEGRVGYQKCFSVIEPP